jgi:hypothetical protein
VRPRVIIRRPTRTTPHLPCAAQSGGRHPPRAPGDLTTVGEWAWAGTVPSRKARDGRHSLSSQYPRSQPSSNRRTQRSTPPPVGGLSPCLTSPSGCYNTGGRNAPRSWVRRLSSPPADRQPARSVERLGRPPPVARLVRVRELYQHRLSARGGRLLRGGATDPLRGGTVVVGHVTHLPFGGCPNAPPEGRWPRSGHPRRVCPTTEAVTL